MCGEGEGERINVRPVTVAIPSSAFLVEVEGVTYGLILTGAGGDSDENGVVEFGTAVRIARVVVPFGPVLHSLM